MSPMAKPHLLCFGLGYTARELATSLANKGWIITGTSRGAAGVAAIEAAGWSAAIWDGGSRSQALAWQLQSATHILLSIPPDADGDPVINRLGDDLRAAKHLCWIGYLSTVGVYGDHQGEWVDEATPPAPASERGQRRFDAEQAWLEFGASIAPRNGLRTHVFRLPGIYGLGRSAIDQLRAGTARRIVKPGQVFNRIHVADIATALEAAMHAETPHQLFNLTDDEPGPAGDVVACAAALLGIEPPPETPFDTADLSPMARSFYGASKRVSNARMKSALGVTLRYPTYREGLAAVMRGK